MSDNFFTLLIILAVCGWFYNYGRRRKNNTLTKVMVGVASFFLGTTVATLLLDFVMRDVLPNDAPLNLGVRIVIVIGCVWITYRLLKRLLIAPQRDIEHLPLDSGLIDRNEEHHLNNDSQ
jgi:hypothetical protein